MATEGRLVRFDDPLGIYIVAVQRQDLLDPDGQPIPEEWVTLTRHGPDLADGLARPQRLSLQAPQGAAIKLSDLRSRRTGGKIRSGAQIAELVELAVYVRVSGPNQLPVEPLVLGQPSLRPCTQRDECQLAERAAGRLEG